MCTRSIYDAIAEGSGFFQHGHTYLSHPAACAAGLAVVQKLVSGLVKTVPEKGAYLQNLLLARFGQHPHVGDIRGRGLFVGVEFVSDRETKAPLDPAQGFAAKLKRAAFEEGLICYPMSGTLDGRFGDHVLLAPPFIAKQEHLNELVDKLGRAFNTVLYDTGIQ